MLCSLTHELGRTAAVYQAQYRAYIGDSLLNRQSPRSKRQPVLCKNCRLMLYLIAGNYLKYLK
jgi:hypothetical protein